MEAKRVRPAQLKMFDAKLEGSSTPRSNASAPVSKSPHVRAQRSAGGGGGSPGSGTSSRMPLKVATGAHSRPSPQEDPGSWDDEFEEDDSRRPLSAPAARRTHPPWKQHPAAYQDHGAANGDPFVHAPSVPATTKAADTAVAAPWDADESSRPRGWIPGVFGFPGVAFQAKGLTPQGNKDLLREAESLVPVLGSKAADWRKRSEAIGRVRGLVYGVHLGLHSSVESREYAEFVDQAAKALSVQVDDLRSTLVKEACVTAAEMSAISGHRFEQASAKLMKIMLNRTIVTIQVAGIVPTTVWSCLIINFLRSFPRRATGEFGPSSTILPWGSTS